MSGAWAAGSPMGTASVRFAMRHTIRLIPTNFKRPSCYVFLYFFFLFSFVTNGEEQGKM